MKAKGKNTGRLIKGKKNKSKNKKKMREEKRERKNRRQVTKEGKY